ncbi:MAG: Hsp70 family protein [Actinobacteria bacterium]|nr:Hsp70 family protein [Actinomycetota bacterium]
MTNICKSDLSYVEIYGGGVRIPKFQQKLAEAVGKDIDKHLNTDESSVLGAAFYAATMSSSFRARPIKVKELSPFGAQVIFQTNDKSGNFLFKETQLCHLEKKDTLLFSAGSRYNAKKTINFSFDQNFTLALEYVSSQQLPKGTTKSIASYQVNGVPTTEMFNFTGKPRLSANFRLDPKGMFEIEKIEAEITLISTVQVPKVIVANKTTETSSDSATADSANNNEESTTPLNEDSDEKFPKSEESSSFNEEVKQEETPEKVEKEAPPKVDDVESTTENVTVYETKQVKRNHRVKLTLSMIEGPGLSETQTQQNLFM